MLKEGAVASALLSVQEQLTAIELNGNQSYQAKEIYTKQGLQTLHYSTSCPVTRIGGSTTQQTGLAHPLSSCEDGIHVDRIATVHPYSSSYTSRRNEHPLANEHKRAQSALLQTDDRMPKSDTQQPLVLSLTAGTPGHFDDRVHETMRHKMARLKSPEKMTNRSVQAIDRGLGAGAGAGAYAGADAVVTSAVGVGVGVYSGYEYSSSRKEAIGSSSASIVAYSNKSSSTSSSNSSSSILGTYTSSIDSNNRSSSYPGYAATRPLSTDGSPLSAQAALTSRSLLRTTSSSSPHASSVTVTATATAREPIISPHQHRGMGGSAATAIVLEHYVSASASPHIRIDDVALEAIMLQWESKQYPLVAAPAGVVAVAWAESRVSDSIAADDLQSSSNNRSSSNNVIVAHENVNSHHPKPYNRDEYRPKDIDMNMNMNIDRNRGIELEKDVEDVDMGSFYAAEDISDESLNAMDLTLLERRARIGDGGRVGGYDMRQANVMSLEVSKQYDMATFKYDADEEREGEEVVGERGEREEKGGEEGGGKGERDEMILDFASSDSGDEFTAAAITGIELHHLTDAAACKGDSSEVDLTATAAAAAAAGYASFGFTYNDDDDQDMKGAAAIPAAASSSSSSSLSFQSPISIQSPYSEPFTASKVGSLTPGNFFLYLPQLCPQTGSHDRIDTSHKNSQTELEVDTKNSQTTQSSSSSSSNAVSDASSSASSAPHKGPGPHPSLPSPIRVIPSPPQRIYAEDVTQSALGFGWRHVSCEEHCELFLQLVSSCRCVCFELLYRRVPSAAVDLYRKAPYDSKGQQMLGGSCLFVITCKLSSRKRATSHTQSELPQLIHTLQFNFETFVLLLFCAFLSMSYPLFPIITAICLSISIYSL